MRGVHTLEVLNLLLKGLADFVHLEDEFSFSLNLALPPPAVAPRSHQSVLNMNSKTFGSEKNKEEGT